MTGIICLQLKMAYAGVMGAALAMEEEYLQVTAGRFTFRVRAGWLYSEDGVWIEWRPEREIARIGLTDYRQQASQNILFVELPERGMTLASGEELAAVESTKVDLSVPAPFSGVVLALNEALHDRPDLINLDPYGAGWLVELRPGRWPVEEPLLADAAYLALMRQAADEAGA